MTVEKSAWLGLLAAALLSFGNTASAQDRPSAPTPDAPFFDLGDTSRVYVVDFSHDIDVESPIEDNEPYLGGDVLAETYLRKRLLLHAIGTVPFPVTLTVYILDSSGTVLGHVTHTVAPGANVSLLNPSLWEALYDDNPFTNHRYTLVVVSQLPVMIAAQIMVVYQTTAWSNSTNEFLPTWNGMSRNNLDVYEIACGEHGWEAYFCDHDLFPATGPSAR